MVEITSRKDLDIWLGGKPSDWAQVIAARAALRALPHAFQSNVPDDWAAKFALMLFRANAISWAARSFPTHDMERAAHAAAEAARPARPAHAAYAAADNAAYAAAAYTAYVAAAADAARAAFGAAFTADAADVAVGAAYAVFWNNIAADCDWLEKSSDGATAARRLTREPLWLRDAPNGWSSGWNNATARLLTLDSSYQVWIDWYNRRITGEDAAFDIPGDANRTEDKNILIKLADATNEDFWDKGATYVNTTLQSWIDEARARVVPPAVNADIPPQNRNAVSFRTNTDGRISIDPTAAGALRTDADARDRHAEAVREAQALLERCRGNNAGARLTRLLENYLAAAGEAVEDIRPSLMVQRGEKLRQEIAALAVPDSLLDPLADDILVDLKGWQSAHNMAVGLDPVLMALDTSLLGPDIQPTLIPPQDLREIAKKADIAEILEEGVRDVLDEAADLAPIIPDPANRRTIWCAETFKNLVIELMSVPLNHPKKALGGIIAVGVAGPIATGAAIGFAWKAAEFLTKHREWIESKLGNTPTWKSLFNQLCDRIEKEAPFKSGSGDE